MPADSTKRYPRELRERAVRMVAELTAESGSQWAAMARVAELLGVGIAETVRKWVRAAEVDGGERPAVSPAESDEVRRLRVTVSGPSACRGAVGSEPGDAAELDRGR